jgi:hypothetical protein
MMTEPWLFKYFLSSWFDLESAKWLMDMKNDNLILSMIAFGQEINCPNFV